LREKQAKEIVAVLTPEQKAEVEKLEAAAAKKRADRKKKKSKKTKE
jgi:Spy/CpxP family protein refolding chaperone